MTQIMPKLHLAFGGAGPFRYQNLYAYPAGDSLWSPKGVAESPEGDGLYGSPPRPYFSS